MSEPKDQNAKEITLCDLNARLARLEWSMNVLTEQMAVALDLLKTIHASSRGKLPSIVVGDLTSAPSRSKAKQEKRGGQDLINTQEVANLMGVTTNAVRVWRQSGKVFAVKVKGGYRYPSWQFEQEVFPILSVVLREMNGMDDWVKYYFFVDSEPAFDNQSPIDLLRHGCLQEVLQLARKKNAANGPD